MWAAGEADALAEIAALSGAASRAARSGHTVSRAVASLRRPHAPTSGRHRAPHAAAGQRDSGAEG